MDDRVLRVVAWVGIVSCLFLGFWLRTGHTWVVFVVIGGLCVAYLAVGARHDKKASSVLPASLDRLAYFSDDASVAFAWLWRKGRAGRLRILRSDDRPAESPDAATGQTPVFDGGDQQQVVDRDVQPHRTYHYTIFVADARGRWSDPIHQPVLTDTPNDREAIEATYNGPPPGSPEAEALLHTRPFSRESSLTNAVAGVATDLIFSAASVFAADKPSEGWEEIK